MASEPGRILSVSREALGSGLTVAATVGASSITVDDPTPFDETGGSLMLDGNVYAYSTVDPVANVITFAGGVTMLTAPGIGELAQDYDPILGLVTIETIAQVEVNSGSGGDAVEAIVDHSLVPLLIPGERGDAGESVIIEQRGLQWWVTKVVGQQAIVTGTTVQTAAPGGLRMWMQSQDPDGAGFEGLYLSSGLAAEDQPGHLILTWDTPTDGPPDGTTGSVDFSIVPPQIGSPPNPAYIVLNQSLAGALLSLLTINADTLQLYGGGSTNLVGISVGASGIVLNAGTPINAHGHGTVGSATTDPSGNVVVTHGMGVTPVSVSPTAFVASNGVGVRLAAKTSTTFTLCFYDTSTKAALGSTNVGFTWDAYA